MNYGFSTTNIVRRLDMRVGLHKRRKTVIWRDDVREVQKRRMNIRTIGNVTRTNLDRARSGRSKVPYMSAIPPTSKDMIASVLSPHMRQVRGINTRGYVRRLLTRNGQFNDQWDKQYYGKNEDLLPCVLPVTTLHRRLVTTRHNNEDVQDDASHSVSRFYLSYLRKSQPRGRVSMVPFSITTRYNVCVIICNIARGSVRLVIFSHTGVNNSVVPRSPMTLLGIKVLRNRVILVYNKLNLEPKTVSARYGNGIAYIHLLTRDRAVRLHPSGANDDRNRDRFPNKGKDVRQRSNGKELLAK